MILMELFYVFFLIGAFTFGGGYAMIAMVQQQVAAREWMDMAAVVDFIAIAESTPGPIAVNMATFVGSKMGGFQGALLATLGVVLPSFLVMLIVARCYQDFCRSKWVKAIMSGLKPAVVGLIGSAVITVAVAVFAPDGWEWEILSEPANWLWLGIAAAMFLVSQKYKKLHPVVLICICAILGIITGYLGL